MVVKPDALLPDDAVVRLPADELVAEDDDADVKGLDGPPGFDDVVEDVPKPAGLEGDDPVEDGDDAVVVVKGEVAFVEGEVPLAEEEAGELKVEKDDGMVISGAGPSLSQEAWRRDRPA